MNIKLFGFIAGAIIVLFLILSLNPIVLIGAGERGVVFNNTNGIQKDILGEGWHLRTPFFQSVHKISVRTTPLHVDLTAGSKDNQTITYKVTVNYHVNPVAANTFYQQLGNVDLKTFLDPMVNQSVKSAAAGFTAEETLTRQLEIRDIGQKLLKEDTEKYNLVIDSLVINDQDFTPQYNKAVEDKAQAKQQAEQAGYLKVQAEAQAQADIAKANGTAQARIVNAKAEAEAQQLLQQALTEPLLQKMLIERWDGHYPTTVLGGSVPLLQLPNK